MRCAGYLSGIEKIYSVSGGSIFAAHLVLNWAKYTGTNEQEAFAAAQEFVEKSRRDIRGRVVRRTVLSAIWFLPLILLRPFPPLRKKIRFSRIGYLIAEYDHLFGDQRLHNLPETPNLNMLTTSMISGDLCQFSRWGFKHGDEQFAGDEIKISFAVASSSAFPPLFPPAKLARKDFGASNKNFNPTHAYLTDGGVFDNSGYQVIDGQTDPAILSDAGAAFDHTETPHFRTIITRTIRATDILMKRLSDETLRNATSHPNLLTFQIGSTIKLPDLTGVAQEENKLISVTAQQLAAKIRTDLDRFTEDEVAVLVLNGFFTAARGLGLDIKTAPKLALFAPKFLDKDHIKRSHRRKIVGFYRKDFMSYVLGITFALLLFVVGAIPTYVYFLNTSEANATQATASQAATGDQLDALNQKYLSQIEDLQKKVKDLQQAPANSCDGTKVIGSFPIGDMPTPDGNNNKVGQIKNAKVTVIDTCTPPNSHASSWSLTYEYYNGQGTQHGDQGGILEFLDKNGDSLGTAGFSVDRGHCVYGHFEKRVAQGNLKAVGPLVSNVRMTIGGVSGRQGGC
jgi:predicted acylesterase/phospholipase RssA